MEFKIKKKEFLNILNLASRAISSTTPLPSLSGIKLVVDKKYIELISSDSNISISSKINVEENLLEINQTGNIVIDAKYILEIVRKIDSEFINVETIDGTLIKIFGGNSEFKINGINSEEYPNINFEYSDNTFNMNTEELLTIIDQTAYACSDKQTRPILTGVNFKAKDGKLYVNATDSYRLASKTIDIDSKLDFNITIPQKYLIDISHSIVDEKEVAISIDSQKIIFIFNNTIISTRLLDDAFPDTSKLIPTSFTQKLIINSKELMDAIDRTSFIKSDGKNTVKMNVKDTEIDLTASNQIGSSYERIIPVSFEGDPFEISFSGKYLLDAIKVFDNQEIVLSFSGNLKPFIITTKNDENTVQLISPVRTY